MSLLGDYLGEIKDKIEQGVDSFLESEASPRLKEIIRDETQWSVVYSYPASQRAMQSRRYGIGDPDEMASWVSEHELVIENHVHLQGGEPGETDIVQEGYGNYRQPYPRPFMDAALNKYISTGEADESLAATLRGMDFEVEVSSEGRASALSDFISDTRLG